VQRPGNPHLNDFVDQLLAGEEWNDLGAGQENDSCMGILRSKIDQEWRLHHDVAQIPVFDNQDAADFVQGRGRRGWAQAIQESDNRASKRFDQAYDTPLPGTKFYQSAERGCVGALGTRISQFCGFRDLNQSKPSENTTVLLRLE
jgi:hypothetical protein